jgi:hypothetical protein
MIRIIERMPEGVLGFEATGKLTANDYTQVLAPALHAASAGPGKIRILLDFIGEFDGMEAGAVWQDLTLGVRDWNAWERIAFVTSHKWMRDGLHMFSWAVPGEARAFTSKDRDLAVQWLVKGS